MTVVQCEVCGRHIGGKPFKVIIEGAKMTVCGRCARLGSGYWEAPPSTRRVERGVFRPPPKTKRQKPVTPQTLELADDFNLRVRRAREKLGMSHQDLGRRMGEKVSVLRKIESGRMLPDNKLAQKLEHVLKTKLFVPFSEPKPSPTGLPLPREVTLGDVARLKVKKAEVNEEREPS